MPSVEMPFTMCSIELLLGVPQLILQPGRRRCCGRQLCLVSHIVAADVNTFSLQADYNECSTWCLTSKRVTSYLCCLQLAAQGVCLVLLCPCCFQLTICRLQLHSQHP
jgi:hypothetical protein